MASRQDAQPASSSSRRAGGRSIGHFVIDKEIGKGSFAQVYLGWHKESKAAVAVKSVEVERLNKKLKENLYGEIQILKTLRHPHIVALHDCIESTSHINLVMEYCELGDLSMFIKKRDKLATHPATHDMARKYPGVPNSGLHEVVIRHFLKQLTSALEFLRSKNYVHRDVKPQNLLLLPSRSFREQRNFNIMEASQDSLIPVAGVASLPMLKLADFGFARVLPSTSLADTLCGSPLYMAPEILRYERYDAKADLWSVGTVLYEMITGRPPFRARNHVELLRKIEAAEDVIKFPREVIVTSEMKALVRSLLKRSPVERLSFENFFTHTVVTSDIPGLVEDDVPQPPQQELRTIPQAEVPASSPRIQHLRQLSQGQESIPQQAPREASHSPKNRTPDLGGQGSRSGEEHNLSGSALPRDIPQGLGIRRPAGPQHAASMPNEGRLAERARRGVGSVPQPQGGDTTRAKSGSQTTIEEERAAQEVMFERDYVVVERKHVEVNALADELAANEKYAQGGGRAIPRGGQIARRYTQQGMPTSTTGAVSAPTSRGAMIAQGRVEHERRSSYERALSASPASASSAISKAIQDASLRLFGLKVPPLMGGKGQSPPMYQAFPAYPVPPSGSAELIKDVKSGPSADEDVRQAQAIEDFATRSDCVYWFAEVKYKQLVPLAPSAETGLGGVEANEMAAEDDGLTVEATVALSEEALVLYVKSLTLLARAMDIASVWWSKKSQREATSGVSAAVSQAAVQRINAVVQWIRQRFNEVLEKSEIVRLKLIEFQKLLPEDHASHPSNNSGGVDPLATSSSAGLKPVYLTPGLSAEKLMYDRALEMSRAAAIDEVTNENLPGCEISYITAIRMLEAVLDGEENEGGPARTTTAGGREMSKDGPCSLDSDEEAHIRKMIKMITGRLSAVRKKQQMISDANRAQASPITTRRRSGDVTPRSLVSQASS